MKILVVDDSRSVRRIMGGMLSKMGHEIYEAEHGKEALVQLKAHPDIGLLMLDWNMPEMNGMELLEEMKKNKSGGPTPTIVMCTTENEMGKIVHAMTKGANEYIMKPFTKEILEEKLGILGIHGDANGG
ncbi:MAG: PleD family two-component system response regulator [Nitrospiria bacterium]